MTWNILTYNSFIYKLILKVRLDYSWGCKIFIYYWNLAWLYDLCCLHFYLNIINLSWIKTSCIVSIYWWFLYWNFAWLFNLQWVISIKIQNICLFFLCCIVDLNKQINKISMCLLRLLNFIHPMVQNNLNILSQVIILKLHFNCKIARHSF